jgi:hypothetical protein
MEDLAKLIATIDPLVAKASTTSDEKKKRECIEEALYAACLYFTTLAKSLAEQITEVLDQTVIGAHAKGLPLTDLISKHEELAVFRDFAALKKEFLPIMTDLLEKQGRLTQEGIREVLDQIKMLHPRILTQETGVAQLSDKILMLKRLFCRSPDEPPPPPAQPTDPNKPPSPPRGAEIRGWLDTLLEYLKYLGPAAGFLVGTQAPDTKPVPQIPPSPPPIVQPWYLRLLALLTMAALASHIDSRGHIPPRPSPRAGDGEDRDDRSIKIKGPKLKRELAGVR